VAQLKQWFRGLAASCQNIESGQMQCSRLAIRTSWSFQTAYQKIIELIFN